MCIEINSCSFASDSAVIFRMRSYLPSVPCTADTCGIMDILAIIPESNGNRQSTRTTAEVIHYIVVVYRVLKKNFFSRCIVIDRFS
jgi:hypothetical protein